MIRRLPIIPADWVLVKKKGARHMTIRNFLQAPLAKAVIHEGTGHCEHAAIFLESDFDTPLRFLNYTVIPPHGSFGLHQHGDDNEIYIILEGAGAYTQDGKTVPVVGGDILLNARFATHGIENTGDIPLRILVIEAFNR